MMGTRPVRLTRLTNILVDRPWSHADPSCLPTNHPSTNPPTGRSFVPAGPSPTQLSKLNYQELLETRVLSSSGVTHPIDQASLFDRDDNMRVATTAQSFEVSVCSGWKCSQDSAVRKYRGRRTGSGSERMNEVPGGGRPNTGGLCGSRGHD